MDSCCDSVAKLYPTLWDLVDCSTPGFPALHCLLEFAQTRGHCFDIPVLTTFLPAHLSSCGGGGPEAPPWDMLRALSSPGPSQADGERGPQSRFSLFLQHPPPPPVPLILLPLRLLPSYAPHQGFCPLEASYLWLLACGKVGWGPLPAGKTPGEEPARKGQRFQTGPGLGCLGAGAKARVHDDPARAAEAGCLSDQRGAQAGLGGEEGRASALALKHSIR